MCVTVGHMRHFLGTRNLYLDLGIRSMVYYTCTDQPILYLRFVYFICLIPRYKSKTILGRKMNFVLDMLSMKCPRAIW